MNNVSSPLVSIIIPVYNTEKYLPQCLDSVLAQSYENIEVICFIDASPDNSLKVAENYAKSDNRVKVINSLTNVKQGGVEIEAFTPHKVNMWLSSTATIG